jgi:ADP-ribose pyrophosphatase
MLFFSGDSSLNSRPCSARPFFFPEDSLDDERVDIIERRTAYEGFFRIDQYRLRHRLHGGGWSAELDREVFERGTAAGALLFDPERDRVVLVEQFRLPARLAGMSPWQLEIVAGIIDPGETAEEVARREIREEAGLEAIGPLVPVHRFLTSPGGTTEMLTLFCARVDSRGAGGVHGLADEGEDIRVVALDYAEAMARLAAGGIENGFTLLALWWLAANRPRLRERWPAP